MAPLMKKASSFLMGFNQIVDYKNEIVAEVVQEPIDLILNLSPVDTKEVSKMVFSEEVQQKRVGATKSF